MSSPIRMRDMGSLEPAGISRPPASPSSLGKSSGKEGPGFGEVLGSALADAAGAERSADEAARRFAAGDPKAGIHEVVIAAEKATIAVKFAVTLKNRAIEAYKDLLNTPV